MRCPKHSNAVTILEKSRNRVNLGALGGTSQLEGFMNNSDFIKKEAENISHDAERRSGFIRGMLKGVKCGRRTVEEAHEYIEAFLAVAAQRKPSETRERRDQS